MDRATRAAAKSSASRIGTWDVRVTFVTSGVLIVVAVVLISSAGFGSSPTSTPTRMPSVTYPVGSVSLKNPSGLGPPGMHALAGYVRTYVTDFRGSRLPVGWESFTGVPLGDPSGQFGAAHVVVANGELQLNTWRDPTDHNKWVTGGVSQSAVAQVYGAYFVRSRVTGLGPSEVQLLWPADNSWPPEIDFNESGRGISGSTATVHWGSLNHIVQYSVRTPLVAWHTWGVIWAPHSITFTLDGHAWAEVTTGAAIPRVPMTLDLEQREMCAFGFSCPSKPTSMLVDWVAEYQRTT